jgi:hypothetical protein
MTLIDKETIRKEIERRREYGKFQYDHIPVGLAPAHYFKGVVDTLEEVLAFLDTLPEQPTQEKEERLDSKKYVRQIVGNEVRYYEIVGKKNQIPTIAEIPSWSYRQTNGLENIIIDSE